MLSKSDTGTYSYTNAAHVHAISSICGVGSSCSNGNNAITYTYDANGNQLTGDGYSTVWTTFNMAQSITRGSATFTYTYDSNNNRASETFVGGPTTEMIRRAGCSRRKIWSPAA